MFGRKKQAALTPPSGLGKEDIAIEKSICTGERVIGFRDPKTKKLLQAVAVRTSEEIVDFYRSYGYEPPEKQKEG